MDSTSFCDYEPSIHTTLGEYKEMEAEDIYVLDLANYYGCVTLSGSEGDWRLELDNYDSVDTLAIPDYLAEAFIKFINEEKEK